MKKEPKWIFDFLETLRYLRDRDHDKMQSEKQFQKKAYHKGRYDALKLIIESIEARMKTEND